MAVPDDALASVRQLSIGVESWLIRSLGAGNAQD